MTALLLLSHQSAPCVNRMIRYWRERTRPDHIVVAYGGPGEEFDGIEGDKVFIDDPRLRTKDHQRECQSYHQVLSAAVALLENRSWEQLYLAEYDMLPIAADLWSRLREKADIERADLLAYRSWRIDDTLHPHYAGLGDRIRWAEWIRSISVRENPEIVLSCMGCGQWWRRPAVEAVVRAGEAVPAYLETQLPSVAHHLGFRVRGMGGQDRFVIPEETTPEQRSQMIRDGAWVVHPDKTLWIRERFAEDPATL